MRKLADGIETLLQRLGSVDSAAAEALRYERVNRLWEQAVESTFGPAARLVLDHTNVVYVMAPDQAAELRRFDRPRAAMQRSYGGNVLVVYADDSTVRSEIDARQQLLAMKCRQLGTPVEGVVILPSTAGMKSRHPFRREGVVSGAGRGDAADHQPPAESLSPEERQQLDAAVQAVENERLREAMQRAIGANFES